MGWLGISDLAQGARAAETAVWLRAGALNAQALVPVGTLMTEIIATARPGHRQKVLGHATTTGWQRAFVLTLEAEGLLTLFMRQGAARFEARLQIAPPSPGDRIRFSYSWNAPAREALISAENLDRETLIQAEAKAPLPLPGADALALLNPRGQEGTATRYLALSNRIEPVGLPPGFLRGTMIETASGPKLIERIEPGEMVPTASGQMAKVRWVTRREVPSLGRFRPVRLRAPYFGLDSSVCVAADHRVQIENVEAEYLFGEDTVLVQARDLVDGRAVQRLPGETRTVWYYHLLLDRHDCVMSNGLWSESLFVGALARQPALLRTTPLAGLSESDVPRHRRHAHSQLSSREAHSLSMAMAS